MKLIRETGIRKFLVLCALVAVAAIAAHAEPGPAGRRQQRARDESAVQQRAASDSLLRLAHEAMRQTRPWRATELITPVVDDSVRTTPDAVILAARAAAAWGGWPEVRRVLAGANWLDTLFGGDGRALLAQARLATGEDTAAALDARLSLGSAGDAEVRGRRFVVLARALAEMGDIPGAASAFDSAAALLPLVRDWLRLRSAEWLADSAARRAVLDGLELPNAVARARTIDAIASENTGDTLGAIARYGRAGDLGSVYRLRRVFAKNAADSMSLRADILASIAGSPTAAQARIYVEVFDSAFTAETPAENLSIARSQGAAGGARTVRAFTLAFEGGLGNENDRFALATLLARLGQNDAAIAAFERVKSPPALAAAAAYQRARTMLRTAPIEETREALRSVAREHAGDTSAATALFLLADLATDDGRDSAARATFQSSAARFPQGTRTPTALFHAAMIAYVTGDFSSAAREFDALNAGYPRSTEATAALYWKGRSLAGAGDSTAASENCARIRSVDSLSYYSMLCSRKLGTTFWAPAAAADSFIVVPSIDSVVARVRLLRELQLDSELASELDRIRALGATDPESLLSAANALRQLGYGSRAIQAAQVAQSRGARPDARLFRLLYPDANLAMVGVEAAQYGLDMDLLAGLIRQESLFNPSATSPAGARGLMQVMPALGADLARSFGFPVWDAVLLYQPDVNARLGVRHFADLVRSQAHVNHVLASYNAGANRVERWLTKRGTDDPEVFVERIPYVETRDYVRIVTRNREMYRILYGR